MLRLLPKTALRRSLHTSARSPSFTLRSRLGLAAGASAVTAYVAWKSLSGPGIALDSVAPSPSKPTQAKPKPPAAEDPVPSQQPDFVPDEPTSSDDAAEAMEALAAEADAESQEAGAGGAFNPVTGEINWDCPCLGGMAYGPCGLQFREAFSCFVFSEKEPKGIDCVEKFKAMQDCFRLHPEVYADDIMDDDEDPDAPVPAAEAAPLAASSADSAVPERSDVAPAAAEDSQSSTTAA